MEALRDTRIPVFLACSVADGAGSEQSTAWLVLDERPLTAPALVVRFGLAAPHPAGCRCCIPRSAAAQALDRLFAQRARGEVAWFTRVVVVTPDAAGHQAVHAALEGDPLVQARFRPACPLAAQSSD